MPELAPVFDSLRRLVLAPAASMDVTRDDGDECAVHTRHLHTRHVHTNGKPLFFGAVARRQARVTFYFMPIDVQPALLDGLSPSLRARLKGKSCFHLKTMDPVLFEELRTLVERGVESDRAQGFLP